MAIAIRKPIPQRVEGDSACFQASLETFLGQIRRE